MRKRARPPGTVRGSPKGNQLGNQAGARSGQPRLQGIVDKGRGAAVEDAHTLPVAGGGDVVSALEVFPIGAQKAIDLGLGSHVEPALRAFSVGVEPFATYSKLVCIASTASFVPC